MAPPAATAPTRRASRAPAPRPGPRAVRPVRIGCSGWNYRDWRERVYPQGLPTRRWLEHYAQLFDTVEVNTTFYRLPRREAVANWAAETPPGFLFAVKASRYLTHIKRLTDLGRGVERFYERIEPLADAGKLGPVLWQLPANFRCDMERLAGPERLRVWRLYLRAARNGFETGLTGVYQMLCSRPLTEPPASEPGGRTHEPARRRVPA